MKFLDAGLKGLFLSACLASLSGLDSLGPRHGLAQTLLSDSQPAFSLSLISSRPKMVYIDALGIFYAPESRYNLYLVGRTWYYYYEGKWYKSQSHEGSWRYVSSSKVPDVLQRLPEQYIKSKALPPNSGTGSPKEKKKKISRPQKR